MKLLEIRPIESRDIKATLNLFEEGFSEELALAGYNRDGMQERFTWLFRIRSIPFKIITKILRQRTEMYVAEKEGKISGIVNLIGLNHPVVGAIVVHPKFRRQGIGRGLMEYVEEKICNEKLYSISLQVLEKNTSAKALYKSLGFRKDLQLNRHKISFPIKKQDPVNDLFSLRKTQKADFKSIESIAEQSFPKIWRAVNPNHREDFDIGGLKTFILKSSGDIVKSNVVEINNQVEGFVYVSKTKVDTAARFSVSYLSDRAITFLPQIFMGLYHQVAHTSPTHAICNVPDHRLNLIKTIEIISGPPVQKWHHMTKFL